VSPLKCARAIGRECTGQTPPERQASFRRSIFRGFHGAAEPKCGAPLLNRAGRKAFFLQESQSGAAIDLKYLAFAASPRSSAIAAAKQSKQ
jgi:hypothetical protein